MFVAGDRNPEEKVATGSGIPKATGSGENRKKLGNNTQYFAIEKAQIGRSQQKQG